LRPPAWHQFEFEGDVYYWRTYPGEHRVGGGPLVASEKLDVAREPDAPGIGRSLPNGTVVTVEHAIEVVCIAKREPGRFP
jgi:hypothetical protein